jgi:hypothetical protein
MVTLARWSAWPIRIATAPPKNALPELPQETRMKITFTGFIAPPPKPDIERMARAAPGRSSVASAAAPLPSAKNPVAALWATLSTPKATKFKVDTLTTMLNWLQQASSATTVSGKGDPGGTFSSQPRVPFVALGNTDAERGQAAVERTLADTAVSSQIQPDEFEVIQHDNGHYTIVLPGVIDLSSPHFGFDAHNQSVRDLDQTALDSSVNASVDSNRYATMVRDYVLDPKNNIPKGANVMLVGHSLGGDTVIDLAADPAFNNAKTGVNVTHVVSAAYFNQPEVGRVPASTQVLVLQNAKDAAVIAEGLGYTATEARQTVQRVVGGAKRTAGDAKDAVGDLLDGDLKGATGNGVDIIQRAQRAITPDNVPVPDAASLMKTGVREIDGHIVEARFNGGSQGAGHHQQNYIDFVNGAGKNDPMVSNFYASIDQAGYTAAGQTKAVDVSVVAPNDKTTYPGDGAVKKGKSLWDRVPGHGLVEDVVGAGANLVDDGVDLVGDGVGAGMDVAGDVASYAWEQRGMAADLRDAVRDGAVASWNAIPGTDAVESVMDGVADRVPFNNAAGAAFKALSGQSHITLDRDATQAIQQDPGFLKTEQGIVNSIKQREGYGQQAMSIPLTDLDVDLVVELGGKRGAGRMKDQLLRAYDLSDPDVAQTWRVATNELTWLLRHARLDGTAHVTKGGTITIDYGIHDQLDLRASPGRSAEYNLISTIAGTAWHDVLGAEAAQITGTFTRLAQAGPG